MAGIPIWASGVSRTLISNYFNSVMRFYTLAAVLLFSCIISLAQTDDVGKTPSKGPKPKGSAPVRPKIVKPVPKSAPRGGGKPIKGPAKSVPGTLTIAVNEPECEVFLLDAAGNNALEVDSQVTGTERAALVIDDIKGGSYTLVVRKPGFAEHRQRLAIAAGKANVVNIDLRAITAFLTISGSIDGAVIEIEGVGSYKGALTRFQLHPGKYNITIQKRGYLTEKHVVELGYMGQEITIIPNLRLVPIAEIIAEAQNALERNDNERAVELSKDVLEIEPGNGKANLILGKAYFQLETRDGSRYLIAALRSGQTVSLPVRIYNKDKRLQLPDGEIMLDRNILYVRSSGRNDLNFTISKQNISKPAIKLDDKQIPFLYFEGTGDVNGKKADRVIRLYSPHTLVTADGRGTFCSRKGASNCGFETESLYDLIVQWQSAML